MLLIKFHPKATKELLKLPANYRRHILKQIEIMANLTHPLQHQRVIKLKGLENNYRLRVGDYRIKFNMRDKELLITHIQHRQVGY